MDKILFRLIESTWGRNILYTLFAVLIGAIFLLWRETARLNEVRVKEQEAWRKEIQQLTERHAEEKDSLRKEQVDKIQKALDEQRKINERIRSLKKIK